MCRGSRRRGSQTATADSWAAPAPNSKAAASFLNNTSRLVPEPDESGQNVIITLGVGSAIVDRWPCLETVLIIPAGVGAPGIGWVEAGVAVQPPAVPGAAP